MDPTLHRAAMEGQVDVLRQHKDQLGVQLTANKSTVLHVAAQYHDNINCVKEILKLQPSLLLQVNSKLETALHIAARNGHFGTVRVLIEHKKSLEESPENPPTLMHFCGSYLSWLCRLVQNSKEMIWMTNRHKDTALHEAVRSNHRVVVEILLREDAGFSHPLNKFGETPLYIAAKKGYHETVSTILETCKSPSHNGPDGRTALHAAVMSGCSECTKKILEKRPKLMNKADLDGWTPLHYAARGGRTDIMKQFLSHSPDYWEIVNGKGQNILHIAKEHEKEEVIKFICSRSVENSNIKNEMDNEGNTPFDLPLSRDLKNSWLNNLENQMDNDGNTPFTLSSTSKKGSTSIEGNKPKEEDVQDYNSTRDAHLVVAALIATVAFTAGLTLPGGFHSNEGPDQGTAVLVRITAFKAFVITNALAMAFSLYAIFVYIFPFDTGRPGWRSILSFSGGTYVGYATFMMMIAFMSGSYAVLSNSSDLAVRVLIIESIFLFLIMAIFLAKTLEMMKEQEIAKKMRPWWKDFIHCRGK